MSPLIVLGSPGGVFVGVGQLDSVQGGQGQGSLHCSLQQSDSPRLTVAVAWQCLKQQPSRTPDSTKRHSGRYTGRTD